MSQKKVDVAVVGATGAVGQAMLEILAEREFPVGNLYPLASARSAGESVLYKRRPYWIEEAEQFDFSKVQLALFSAGGSVSAQLVPKAVEQGCLCIDNTSHFRLDPKVPLVVPEVNPEAIQQAQESKIIANPNCSTIQMVVVLKPIYDAVGITRVNVATYQSVSGAGSSGLKELARQTAAILSGQAVEVEKFPKQIAFNAIPQIDVFTENGYTKEEMKMVNETQKILGDSAIQVNPTAVRIPVFYGHAEAIHLETKQPLSSEDARNLLMNAKGIVVFDQLVDGIYPTQAEVCQGQDGVYVGRIRKDISHPQGLNLWVVADNVRKGAALNAIQIAELCLDHYF